MPKLTERDLKALLQAERLDALSSSQSSELSKQREDAMRYYMGDMSTDMPSIEGRSSAVSTDVSDTIEGLMPNLMDIFAGSDDVVRFDPVGPEDVDAAQQETDYVNYVFMQLNQGFMVLYSMIKDALLSKTGICKVWWEEKESEDRDTYYSQPEDVYAFIASDPDVEIVEHTANEDGTHDFTIKSTKDESKCCVEPVPPEEFGISRRARMDIQSAHYMFHETTDRTQSSLIEDGYDAEQIKGLSSYATPTEQSSQEEYARDTVQETSEPGGDESLNKAMRRIRTTEHYVKMDYKGDGVARRYMVVTGGEDSTVLRRDGKPHIEEIDWWPFAAMTPVPQTHRWVGRSVADLVMDIQRINTALTRGLLDNVYLSTNVRTEVPEQAATPETFDDLLNSRPGGIVRTRQPGMLREIVHTDIGGTVYPALQYFDAKREWRTGVSRQGQGLDADALNNQTATAAMQLYNAAQSRMKLIARIFAETGVCDMFWLIHSTIRKYGDQAATVKLRNQWVTVDPRNWKSRKDMTIDVGLGRGGKAEEMQSIMGLIGLQKAALEGGLSMLVAPKQLYNSAADYAKIIGKKDIDRYFTDPGDDAEMPPAPPDPQVIKAQIDAQLKMQELQGKAEIERLQAQADITTQQTKIAAELEMKREEHQMKMAQMQAEHSIKMQEMGAKVMVDQVSTENKMALGEQKLAQSDETHKQKMEQAKTNDIAKALKPFEQASPKKKPSTKKVKKTKGKDGSTVYEIMDAD